MSTHYVHRHYGHGAARLPIGLPCESHSLSRAARRRSSLENLASLSPGLLCALAFLALAASIPSTLDRPFETAQEATRIELDAWPLEETPRTPVIESIPIPRVPVETAVAAVQEEVPSPAPGPAKPAAPRRTLDLRSLVTASKAVPHPATPPPRRTPAPSRRPTPSGLPTSHRLVDLHVPVPANADVAWNGESAFDAEAKATADPTAARPAARGVSTPDAPLGAAESVGQKQRSDFLATLALANRASRGAGALRESPPPVALAAASSDVTNELTERLHHDARAAGWHEVPLEDLPDCSPAGRQDQLKRQILLAAPQGATCSHAEGQYRFLETRNLNAFLMWSRTNPAAFRGQDSVRDVCDVLTRALHCLENSATEEPQAR